MKPEKYSTGITDNSALDAELKDILKKELPECNSNPWFTRRVMNRLPDNDLIAKLTFLKSVCYALSFVGMVILGFWAYQWFSAITFSVVNILIITLVIFAILVVVCLMMLPTFVRIVREP